MIYIIRVFELERRHEKVANVTMTMMMHEVKGGKVLSRDPISL